MKTELGTVQSLAQDWNVNHILETGLANNLYIELSPNAEMIKGAIRRIPVFVNSRLRTASGRAFIRAKQIELHAGLIDQNDPLWHSERIDTFFHEISHLVAAMAAKHFDHGEPWREAMRAFGFKPQRCYSDANPASNHRAYKVRKEAREVEEIANLLPDMGM